jgi:spore maturation protein CgeB
MGDFVSRIRGSEPIKENVNLSLLPSVPFDEMIQNYGSYSLSIAYTSSERTDILRNPLKIIDLRNFEIPMCGGVELCRYNKELASYFEDGKEMVFYNSDEEMIEKATYYTQKASDAEIRRIKAAARKKAENEHNWRVRFVGLFQELGLKC